MRSCDFNWQARAGEIKKSGALVRAEFNVLGVRCIICVPTGRYVSTVAGTDVTLFLSVFLARTRRARAVGDVPSSVPPNFSSSN